MLAPYTSDSIVPIVIAVGISGGAMLLCAVHFCIQKCVQYKKKRTGK